MRVVGITTLQLAVVEITIGRISQGEVTSTGNQFTCHVHPRVAKKLRIGGKIRICCAPSKDLTHATEVFRIDTVSDPHPSGGRIHSPVYIRNKFWNGCFGEVLIIL